MRRCLASPRKTRYSTQQDALAAIRGIEFWNGYAQSGGFTFVAYRCQGCNGWHLTKGSQ